MYFIHPFWQILLVFCYCKMHGARRALLSFYLPVTEWHPSIYDSFWKLNLETSSPITLSRIVTLLTCHDPWHKATKPPDKVLPQSRWDQGTTGTSSIKLQAQKGLCRLAARSSSGDFGAEKAQLHRFANKANENPFYLYQTSIYQCLFSAWKNKMTLLPEKRERKTPV